MTHPIKIKFAVLLIPLLAFVTACTQTAEPTESPTATAEASPTSEPTTTPSAEPVQTRLIIGEVVVENFIVQKKDDDSGEIEIVVQGYTSNTCTTIDDISISREGDIFSIDVETSPNTQGECEEQAVQFQEVVPLDTGDLAPGTYLLASGAVERFEIQAAQPPEEPKETAETPDEGETTTGEEPPQDDTGAGMDDTAGEPRDCQDVATFLADVTYPDNTNIEAGEVFTKTWEIRNDGTCTWGAGYELEFVTGDFPQADPLMDPFPEIAPSETVELSAAVTAPDTAGTHSGTWVIMRPEGDNIQTQDGLDFDLWAIVVVPGGAAGNTGDETRVIKDGVVCALTNSSYDSKLLQLINDARAANGLPAYELQSQLTNAAWRLTNDMACNDFVSHTGSDGSTWFTRIADEDYVYIDAAENIYFGYGVLPEMAMNWWMNSEIHRGNILNSTLTQIGIAYGLNPQTGASYYTLTFALPEE